MFLTENYLRVEPCHIGEVDGFGYAYVPGSDAGVVLLDMRSKQILEGLPSIQDDIDRPRLELMINNGLVRLSGEPVPPDITKYRLEPAKVTSMSTWLHVTNNCNLDCPYCYIAHKGDGHMSLDIASQYIDKLEEAINVHHLQKVAIRFAGGEPDLNRSVIKYVVDECHRRLISRNVGVQFLLITNGTTLSSKWIDFLTEHSVGINISLDGVGDMHDVTRFFKNGRGSFRRVEKSIDLCLKRGVMPCILTTITDANIKGIPLLSRFLIDRNLQFRYGVYRDYAGDHSGYQEFIQQLQIALDDCYDYYANAIRQRKADFRHQLCDLHLDRRPHLRCCNVGYSGVTVSHNGQVFVCQSQMDKQPLGRLDDSATLLQMAWSQQTIPGLTNRGVAGYSPCNSCMWALVCGGGCPVTNVGYSGTAESVSPYCELFNECIPSIIQLKAIELICLQLNNNLPPEEVNC